MRLNFRQRFFSWLDSDGIYGEDGNTVFTVEGRLGWGHCLYGKDAHGTHVGALQEWVFTFLPQLESYINGNYNGCIKKEFVLFKPQLAISRNGRQVDGQWMEWDCAIMDGGQCVLRPPGSCSVERIPMQLALRTRGTRWACCWWCWPLMRRSVRARSEGGTGHVSAASGPDPSAKPG